MHFLWPLKFLLWCHVTFLRRSKLFMVECPGPFKTLLLLLLQPAGEQLLLYTRVSPVFLTHAITQLPYYTGVLEVILFKHIYANIMYFLDTVAVSYFLRIYTHLEDGDVAPRFKHQQEERQRERGGEGRGGREGGDRESITGIEGERGQVERTKKKCYLMSQEWQHTPRIPEFRK